MIYTLTFNPCIDYVMNMPSLTAGDINRAESEEVFIGGKGINVSLVLKQLGMPSTALGFTAGFTGTAIKQELEQMGVKTDFVHLSHGFSRINVKVKSQFETDLNGNGPKIYQADIDSLIARLSGFTRGDVFVLSGSVPCGVGDNIYERILESLEGRGVITACDATGKLLLNCLKYRPFVVKPNICELGEMFGVRLDTVQSAVPYAKKLCQMGAQNVLVSMAEKGAFLLERNGEIHFCDAAKGRLVNSTGAGDSMLAGFLAGYLKTGDFGYALTLGTAAGGATAFSSGLARADEIYGLFDKIMNKVTE